MTKVNNSKDKGIGISESIPQTRVLPETATRQGKSGSKKRQPQIGGTAVPGARSTQQKEVAATNPQEQQYEAYNRTMRRRMRQMGTDPETQQQQQQEKVSPRKKRMEQQRAKLEARRKELMKDAPKIDTAIGKRGLWIFLGLLAVVAIIIVIAILINHPF